jgi:hypothetical protein
MFFLLLLQGKMSDSFMMNTYQALTLLRASHAQAQGTPVPRLQ